MAQKTIEFKLPNQLVETLNEFMAMGIDINLLLTQFLKMLRDIWISGKEAERKACKEEIEKREKIDKIIKIEELEKKCIETASKKYRFIVRKFNDWLNKQNMPIEQSMGPSKELPIEEFIKQYIANRQLKPHTLYIYKRALKKHLECLSEAFRSQQQ
ncbi:MAG TPA: hypothetical protein VNL13_09710 [Sulfolobales archaeon]|nr:hypothetical protein [Sulfolobales archaeon]